MQCPLGRDLERKESSANKLVKAVIGIDMSGHVNGSDVCFTSEIVPQVVNHTLFTNGG